MRQMLLAAALVMAATAAHAQVYVQGYTTANGTYVQGHYRSAPNQTRIDNYTTQGNVNPYTGAAGTVDPYAQPTYPQPAQFKPYVAPAPAYNQPYPSAAQRRRSSYGN